MFQWLRIAVVTAPLIVVGAKSAWFATQDKTARRSVVVELFTSEGCSSCPPADELLSRLREHKALSGVDIIPLGFHVDYWNYLGWRDRFSSSQFSLRQQEYATKFRLGGPYTPQMVVQGAEEFVGSSQEQASRAIAQAAIEPEQAQVEISALGETLQVTVHGNERLSANVILAITEDELETRVGGGENGGRVLHHSAVVRSLRILGRLKGGNFEAVVPVNSQNDWKRQNLHAVVFVQNTSSYRIEGAAHAALVRS